MRNTMEGRRRFLPMCENLEARRLQSAMPTGDASNEAPLAAGTGHQASERRSVTRHAFHDFQRFKRDLRSVSRDSHATESELLALGLATRPLVPAINVINNHASRNTSAQDARLPTDAQASLDSFRLIEATDEALLYGWASDEEWTTSAVRAKLYNELSALGFTPAESDGYVSAARAFGQSIGCSSGEYQKLADDTDNFVYWHRLAVAEGYSYPLKNDPYVYVNNNRRSLFVK